MSPFSLLDRVYEGVPLTSRRELRLPGHNRHPMRVLTSKYYAETAVCVDVSTLPLSLDPAWVGVSCPYLSIRNYAKDGHSHGEGISRTEFCHAVKTAIKRLPHLSLNLTRKSSLRELNHVPYEQLSMGISVGGGVDVFLPPFVCAHAWEI